MPIMQMKESNPDLFEESVNRRGQHIFWYSANSCFCSSDNGKVDPNCPQCFGKGFLYSPVLSTRRITWGITTGTGTINAESKGVNIKSINRVFINRAEEIQISSFTSTTFTPSLPVKKGVRYTLDYEHSFEEEYSGLCNYIGKGIIEVPVRLIHNQNYFAGMMNSISQLRKVTRAGEIITYSSIHVISYWGNQILTDTVLSESDEIEIVCKYIHSPKFLVVSINPKTKVDNNLILQQADAMMVYPGTYHVGRGDVIVLQMGEIRESSIGINDSDIYKFPYFKIARVLKIEDHIGEITDYSLVRNNEIVWGSRKPKRFAVTFTYHPAFSVMDDLPNVRYSEDKIWVKRVFLKKFPLFNYANKVLTQYDPNIDETGLLDDPRKEMEYEGII
jgi:hypothetical protein